MACASAALLAVEPGPWSASAPCKRALRGASCGANGAFQRARDGRDGVHRLRRDVLHRGRLVASGVENASLVYDIGQTLDEELDFYRDDDDVAVLFDMGDGETAWIIGNIEEVGVARGEVRGTSPEHLLGCL